MLGRFEQADAHFTAAAELCERNEMRSWLAQTRCDWARILTARNAPGDTQSARDLATQGLETAEEIGMAQVVAQATGILEAESG